MWWIVRNTVYVWFCYILLISRYVQHTSNICVCVGSRFDLLPIFIAISCIFAHFCCCLCYYLLNFLTIRTGILSFAVLCGFFVCQWKYSHWESFTLRTHGNRTTRTQRINALFYIENQTKSKEACSSKEMRMSIHIKIRKWNGIIILSVKVSME